MPTRPWSPKAHRRESRRSSHGPCSARPRLHTTLDDASPTLDLGTTIRRRAAAERRDVRSRAELEATGWPTPQWSVAGAPATAAGSPSAPPPLRPRRAAGAALQSAFSLRSPIRACDPTLSAIVGRSSSTIANKLVPTTPLWSSLRESRGFRPPHAFIAVEPFDGSFRSAARVPRSPAAHRHGGPRFCFDRARASARALAVRPRVSAGRPAPAFFRATGSLVVGHSILPVGVPILADPPSGGSTCDGVRPLDQSALATAPMRVHDRRRVIDARIAGCAVCRS